MNISMVLLLIFSFWFSGFCLRVSILPFLFHYMLLFAGSLLATKTVVNQLGLSWNLGVPFNIFEVSSHLSFYFDSFKHMNGRRDDILSL